MTGTSHQFTLSSEAETAELAQTCAAQAQCGDVFLLGGPIGAGKSTFARAFIRARLKSPNEDVPSPTFTIVQTYEHSDGDIWHCDLYRLGGPNEIIELGLEDAFSTAICLIEWPDRLADLQPDGAIVIDMEATEAAHIFRASGPNDALERLFGRHV